MSSAATAVLAARQPRTLPTAAPTSVSTTGESSDNGGMIMAVVFCVVGAIVVLRMVLWYRRLRAQEAQQAELERELATLVQEQSALQLQVTGLKDDFISTLPTREFHSNDMPAEDANCAVCISAYQESQTLRVLPCAHHFHQECVDKWLQKSQLCPLCNQNVTQAHNLHASTPGSSSVPLPPALPNQPIDEADAAAVAGGVAEGCSVDIEPIEVRSSPVAIQIDSSA